MLQPKAVVISDLEKSDENGFSRNTFIGTLEKLELIA